MATQIFVNLPVKDLSRSITFFSKLGFSFNQQFTDRKATCMIIGENIFVMLLVEQFFETFTKKAICNTAKSQEAIIAISANSRAEVDEMFHNALAAGAGIAKDTEDHGWMYGRSFQDPDGHHWEVLFTDMEALKAQSLS